jgi:hypothetical protein
MLKRTLIAIAVVALLATSVQALGPTPHYKSGESKPGNGLKVNIQNVALGWPVEYKALDLCVIPVYISIGYFVEVKECHKRKIKLIQVECGDMKKGSDWPCYADCEDVQVRSNFEAKLGLSLRDKGSMIDKWDAYFKIDDAASSSATVAAATGWQKVTVCVEAWKAKLLNSTPGTEVKAGNVVITVKPNV